MPKSVVTNTTVRGEIQTLGPLTPQLDAVVTTRPLRRALVLSHRPAFPVLHFQIPACRVA